MSPIAIDKALIADRIGHGLGSTKWNGDHCIVFLSGGDGAYGGDGEVVTTTSRFF